MDVKMIFLLFIGFILCQVSTESEFEAAKRFLLHYGRQYDSQSQLSSISHENTTFKEAVPKSQELSNLKIIDKLDNNTIKMMKSSRCRFEDKINPQQEEHSRFRRYSLIGGGKDKWDKLKLTYRIIRYSRQLGRMETEREIRRAFDKWSEVSPLTFSKKIEGQVDIPIEFASIDDHGPVLGTTYPLKNGKILFDDAEPWSSGHPILFNVALHEIGHSLGLDHSEVKDAVMYGMYNNIKDFQLHQDDIDGIQALYGKKERPARRNREDWDNTHTRVPPSTNDIYKDGKLDAVFKSLDGSIYILKGSSYWDLGKEGSVSRLSDYPRSISEKWIGLPSNIDAAFVGLNGRTYFFKGSKYYRYSADNMDRDYPKEISGGFPGIPNDIDAATWDLGSNRGFFFKGDKYWVIDAAENVPLKSKYPQSITNFKGIPSNLDDVLISGGKVYFFKDGWYYVMENSTFQTEDLYITHA